MFYQHFEIVAGDLHESVMEACLLSDVGPSIWGVDFNTCLYKWAEPIQVSCIICMGNTFANSFKIGLLFARVLEKTQTIGV